MRLVSLIILLSLSFNANAESVDQTFSGGEEQFQFERYDDGGVMMKINEDAKMDCTDGVCRLHTTKNEEKGHWEVSFNIGEGAAQGGGANSTNIFTGGDTYCRDCPRGYWGVQVKYVGKKTCTQTVGVPRSVYESVNRYMYGLMSEEGGLRKGFTPADEAMIMFYTTITSKATGCISQ